MNQKQQLGVQVGSMQRLQEGSSLGQTKKQEPIEAERKDLGFFLNRGEKKFTEGHSEQYKNLNSESYEPYNSIPGLNDQSENNFFENFFKHSNPNEQIQQSAAFGIPLSRLSLKDDDDMGSESQYFKIPPLEENKQGTFAEPPQYSYLSKSYQGLPLERSAGFESHQNLGDKIGNQVLSDQAYLEKPHKSASDEKILKKFMSKVTGLPNMQLSTQFNGSLTDRRPATTKPSLKHVWKYKPSSQVKAFETLIGPDEEDEDAEDDEDYVASHNYRRNTVFELTQNNQSLGASQKSTKYYSFLCLFFNSSS